MRAAFVPALFATLLAFGCTPTTPPPVDAGEDVIEEVAEDAGTDVQGTDTDPNFLPDGAMNPCLAGTNCSSCTALTPCGWCGNRCLSGTEAQSFDGTCSGAQWMWRGVQCPNTGTQCPTHMNCNDCASDPNSCGWCANTMRCYTGDSRGPAMAVDGCTMTSGAWMYRTDQCR